MLGAPAGHGPDVRTLFGFLPDLFLVGRAGGLKQTPGGADGTGMSSSSVVVSLSQPAANPEPGPGAQPASPVSLVPVNLPVDLPTMLRELEDAYIRAALTRTQFNKKEAAKLLGMGRTTLVEKLRRRNLAARSA